MDMRETGEHRGHGWFSIGLHFCFTMFVHRLSNLKMIKSSNFILNQKNFPFTIIERRLLLTKKLAVTALSNVSSVIPIRSHVSVEISMRPVAVQLIARLIISMSVLHLVAALRSCVSPASVTNLTPASDQTETWVIRTQIHLSYTTSRPQEPAQLGHSSFSEARCHSPHRIGFKLTL